MPLFRRLMNLNKVRLAGIEPAPIRVLVDGSTIELHSHGSPSRIRTVDIRINSATLYR